MTPPAETVTPELPADIGGLRSLLLTTLTERDAVTVERDELLVQNDRLRHLLLKLRRMQFGAKSGRLPEEQLQLALEDLEQAVAQGEAVVEKHDPEGAGNAAAEAGLPGLCWRRGSRTGAVPADRGRDPDRGAGLACAGIPFRRPSAVVSPGSDHGAPGGGARSFHAGVLDGLRTGTRRTCSAGITASSSATATRLTRASPDRRPATRM